MKLLSVLCLASLFIFCGIAPSEEQVQQTIRAVKIDNSEAPKIDGKLDDECWKKADKANGFIQLEPIPGEKAKEPTNVYVLYDSYNLYIGVECLKNDPSKVFAKQTKRDSEFFQDDFFEVFLDTFHDHRNCYSFAVNCIGAQTDRRIANEGSVGGGGGPMNDPSKSWDCGWTARTAKTDNGWSAEIAIPFSELRFNRNGDGTWGINFIRGNSEFRERDTWANVGERALNVSRFGNLIELDLRSISVTRKVELKPYTTVKPQLEPKREVEPSVGIDIRYPSSKITADFTLYPDYAQIEADPTRINLRDVEEILPEKRPFFQEGMELFQSPIMLFYTRRVGITDIKYGAKAVGKLDRFSLAFVNCMSNDMRKGDPMTEQEKRNNYAVFRAQTDIGSNSSIGLLGVNKQKEKGYNRAAGIDLNIALPNDVRLISQVAKSWFPDKEGNAALFSLKRRSRTGFSFEIEGINLGRNFNVESGYIPRLDRRGGKVSTGYGYRREAEIFKYIDGEISYERLYNSDRTLTNERGEIEIGFDLADFHTHTGLEWYYHVDEFDITKAYNDRTVFCFAGYFPPKMVSIMMPTMFGRQNDKRVLFLGPGINLTPITQLRIEVNVERFDREGEPLMLNRRFGVTYQIRRDMFARSFFEITRDNTRYLFLLFSWEFRPESNLFLVYTDDKKGDEVERAIFFKVAYLFSLKLF